MAIEQNNYGSDLTSIGLYTNGALYAEPIDNMGRVIGKSFSLGLVSGIDATFEATKIDLYSAQTGPRSKFHTVTTETNGSVSFTFNNFNAQNMALYAYGDLTKITAAPVKTETVNIYADSFHKTADIAETLTSIAVGGIELEEGKNFEISKGGLIYFYSVEDQTAKGALEIVPDTATSAVIVYAAKAFNRIQAFTKTSNRFRIFYNGLNTADGDESEISAVFHYVELDPGQIPFASTDNFGEITLTGSLLKARSIAGAGISQFAQIDTVK